MIQIAYSTSKKQDCYFNFSYVKRIIFSVGSLSQFEAQKQWKQKPGS